MWYLIGLAWIAAMVFIISRYTRKQRQSGARRAAEMTALLADLKANPQAAAALAMSSKPAAPVVAAAAPEFGRKERLLEQPAALLYYVFRSGLPDHEIFSRVALGDVVEVAPSTIGAQRELLVRRLAQLRLDLVVCNKQFEVVAVVIAKNTPAGQQTGDVQFATRCLEVAGIRVVSIDPAAPPRHHQVQALVYG